METSWSEIYELLYIPMFGGGFSGIDYNVAVGMKKEDRRRALRWLENRRNDESKAFKGNSGSKGGLSAPPREPRPPEPSKFRSPPEIES